ncbi:MAG: hypothetical protein HXS46_05005 [Theionarchaea archaeon]|nr:MAG: hypothetical protein AYK18_14400 [Theionarchaea archaeon DG-70]MBU7010026.1 hypothetical protein [Theionarchaea archaeon]
MSDFQEVIGKAVTDKDFRKELFTDVRGTLKANKFTLESKEIERLESLDPAEAESALEELEERMSKSDAAIIGWLAD